MTATQPPAVVPADPATAGHTSGQGPLPGGGEAVTGADTLGEDVNAAVTALPVARAPEINPVVAFTVYGVPVAQGSLRNAGPGRTFHDNDAALSPWRKNIAVEARIAMDRREPFIGPVSVSAVFTLTRPASVRRKLPHVRPDLDKYARALLDALTRTVYVDDGQVIRLSVAKVYVDDRLGLHVPGVEVMCRAVTP